MTWFIRKSIEDVVPTVMIKTNPTNVRQSKRQNGSTGTKVESQFNGSDTRRMWQRLQTIMDYKGKARPPEWRSGLRHCITVLAVPLEILVQVQARSQPATTERPMGQRTIGPTLARLGESLARRDVLVPSHTSDSCGGLDAMHADTIARYMVFPPTHLCVWPPG